MDRREIELQIRIIRVTFRGESRDENSEAMRRFRARAAEIFRQVEPLVTEFPDLAEQLAEVRQEIGVPD